MSANTSNNDHELIPSPKAEQLKKQCAQLTNELAELLSEKDHLTSTVIPNITARYATVVGGRECERLRLDIEVRRLKSILEHIQAIENRGANANLEQIEAAVEDELRDWNAQLQSVADQVLAGKEHLEHQMSLEETAEFRKLYRALVSRLHPDVNPDFASRHRALWSQVQQAYQLGDLDELRALMLVVDDTAEATDEPTALAALHARCERLRAVIRVTLDQITTIKESPPFALFAKLNNPAWVADTLSKCEEHIASLTSHVAELSAKLAAWKSANG
jgi:hypothetical protein